MQMVAAHRLSSYKNRFGLKVGIRQEKCFIIMAAILPDVK